MMTRRRLVASVTACGLAPSLHAVHARSAGIAPDRSEGLPARLSPRPLICAHRGWLDPEQAENDLAQIGRTTDAGPFMVEVDLAETRDGTIVLMHDQTVDRTTTGHGAVAELTRREIDGLRLRDRRGVTDEGVPGFDALLRWAAGTPPALLMLDIKAVGPERVARLVRDAGLEDRAVLLTFSADNAARAFAGAGRTLVSCLVKGEPDLSTYAAMAGGRRFAAYIPRTAPPDLFAAAHRRGCVVISDVLTRDALMDALSAAEIAAFVRTRPVDILVTNHPRATLGAVRKG
ncbi:glycerophosphodiester phosphodiesterase family protein [Gluconacetobacter takamatsuzukensis]|uniref:Glycerophosphodiester phosphodiesterase family protein n=1 Tax=Gluconacetobacter takamatsuzukensis TaxID=1286190 RepID=A0A7W4PQH9_9PROT|nr:glycerophosphodiester phosphodiesterase family protein [Gluconacetobacter takamatsuzukensis]MBB2206575.1 glycerophosphodiester phosphodiesterase family protein [Gluconacetobacter takamatsuzukensis]